MVSKPQVPQHIAIIMDGNNRWAKRQGMGAVASGHSAGAETIRGVLQAAKDEGVFALTLFAFSSENWERPKAEVDALMRLLAAYLKEETEELMRKNVRIRFIGRRDRFNDYIRNLINSSEERTRNNSGFALTIAADYGGMWDIMQAAVKLTKNHTVNEIDDNIEDIYPQYLSLSDLPSPDLLIRTGGEHRISNFMLWQCAYAELYFTDVFWPDFKGKELREAIVEFQSRERRFGKTSEQVKGKPSA